MVCGIDDTNRKIINDIQKVANDKANKINNNKNSDEEEQIEPIEIKNINVDNEAKDNKPKKANISYKDIADMFR